MQHITFVIDGNFFAQRLRNSEDLKFIDNPEEDAKKLIKRCTESLVYEISNTLNNQVDHVIIARDFSSWRKDITQTYPLTTTKDAEIQDYKKNRDKEKDYDEVKFYEAYEKWLDLMSTNFKVQVVKSYKAEADDICYVLSTAISKNENRHVIVWSSDKDYYQLVKERISLLKLPQKHLCLLNTDSSTKEIKTVYSIFEKKDLSKLTQIKESFDKSEIKYINPITTVFNAIIMGDAKDNVPPLWNWRGGSTNRKPNATHLKKVFEKINHSIDDLSYDNLYDLRFIQQLIFELFFITKQHERTVGYDKKTFKKSGVIERVRNLYFNNTKEIVKQLKPTEYENLIVDFLKHTEYVFASNRKMKLLYHKEIPVEIIKNILTEFQNTVCTTELQYLKDSKVALQKIGIQNANASGYFNNFKNLS